MKHAYATSDGVVLPIIANGYDDLWSGSARGQEVIVAGKNGGKVRFHTGYLDVRLRAYVEAALARNDSELLIRRRADLSAILNASESTRDARKDALVGADESYPESSDEDPETVGERRLACDPE